MRVLKLLQFMEAKGPEGFQRFLKALEDEPEHLGHREITQLFASYRKFILFLRENYHHNYINTRFSLAITVDSYSQSTHS